MFDPKVFCSFLFYIFWRCVETLTPNIFRFYKRKNDCRNRTLDQVMNRSFSLNKDHRVDNLLVMTAALKKPKASQMISHLSTLLKLNERQMGSNPCPPGLKQPPELFRTAAPCRGGKCKTDWDSVVFKISRIGIKQLIRNLGGQA